MYGPHAQNKPRVLRGIPCKRFMPFAAPMAFEAFVALALALASRARLGAVHYAFVG